MTGKLQELGVESESIVAVLSGGNIDPMLMLKVIQVGLASAGRFLSVKIALRDRSGELQNISRIIAENDARVTRVDQSRVGAGLTIGGAHIPIDMEIRGKEYSEQVLEALREAGYEPMVQV